MSERNGDRARYQKNRKRKLRRRRRVQAFLTVLRSKTATHALFATAIGAAGYTGVLRPLS